MILWCSGPNLIRMRKNENFKITKKHLAFKEIKLDISLLFDIKVH